jgi:hypothetical protein
MTLETPTPPFHPIIKSAGQNGFVELEQAPFVRYVQPLPSSRNTAKTFAAYHKEHDGPGNSSSLVMAAPGSPVRLEPFKTWILSPQIEDIMSGGKARSNVPQDANSMQVLIMSEYEPKYGAEEHFFFSDTRSDRLPTAVAPNPGSTIGFMRFPNPGKRKIAIYFNTNATCTMRVVGRFSAPFGGLTAQEQAIAAAPEVTPTVGTTIMVPQEWELELTAVAGVPTLCQVFISFHDIET